MEEYRDLELTVAVFIRLLDRPEFRHLHAGIVLQAYLPDTLATMMQLQDWAARRVAEGGAPIKVRIVKGANLPMERVEAAVHDWPLGHLGQQAGHRHQLQAAARLRAAPRADGQRAHRCRRAQPVRRRVRLDAAKARHVGIVHSVAVDFEMLLGMAQGQAEAVRREVGGLLLYTPVVHPRRVRRRDRLPRAPARGGRQPGQLHVRRLRAQRQRRAVRPRARPLRGVAGRAGRRPTACR